MASYLNPEQLKRAIQLKASGHSGAEIAAELGVPTWKLYLTDEYKNAPSGERDETLAGPKKKPGRPKVKKATAATPAALRTCVTPTDQVAIYLPRTCVTPTDQVAIYLPVEKLDKLWNLLSLDEKVAVISHVL